METLLELLASGMTIEEIVDDHPDLERDDLLAALEFGDDDSGLRVGDGGDLLIGGAVAVGKI